MQKLQGEYFMPWWLILIAVILLLLVLGALHPLRLKVEGQAAATLDLRLTLMPFGIFPFKIRIIDIKDTPYDQLGQNRKTKKKKKKQKSKNKDQTENKEKQSFTETIPFGRRELFVLLDKALGRLRIETLELEANLAGDPYHCGVACGALWIFFGGGFAFLSSRVKKFAKKPIMNFGVDLNNPWSAHFKMQIMLRVGDLGRIGIKVLWAVIKNKCKNRHKTDDNAENNNKNRPKEQIPNCGKQSAV